MLGARRSQVGIGVWSCTKPISATPSATNLARWLAMLQGSVILSETMGHLRQWAQHAARRRQCLHAHHVPGGARGTRAGQLRARAQLVLSVGETALVRWEFAPTRFSGRGGQDWRNAGVDMYSGHTLRACTRGMHSKSSRGRGIAPEWARDGKWGIIRGGGGKRAGDGAATPAEGATWHQAAMCVHPKTATRSTTITPTTTTR